MHLNPYLFGYFSKCQTWKDVQHLTWVREFLDVIEKHEPTRKYLQKTQLSAQTVHRFTTTQQQAQKRFASQTRMRVDRHTNMPYASLDWQTPLGIVRFVEEICAGPSGKIPEVFVRFVPKHDTLNQRLAEVCLGRANFETLLLERKWIDAQRVLAANMCRARNEYVRKLILEVDSNWSYPASVSELERLIFSSRKRSTLELLKEIRDVSTELKTFLQNGSLDAAKIQTRLNRMDRIVQIGSSLDVVEVTADDFQSVFVPPKEQDRSDRADLQEECDRLSRLLEQHKIDYIRVPSNSIEQVQTFIAEQIARQQQLARVILDDSSSNADKFTAENEIDKIQKKVETAKRKQFEFDVFMNERIGVLHSLRDFGDQIRSKLVERYKDVDATKPFAKLPFRTRRLFPDSDIGAFVQESNTHFQCWLSAVRGDTSVDYFKYANVRKGMGMLLENHKVIPALLFLFHFGYERFLQAEDTRASTYSFLLHASPSLREKTI
jgi:hypothetical protein